MGQGTEACGDRPSEVSVIRFVSRNRTIEEIAPKKEVYTCKQRGCGKIFTNQDEYKTHEALEALKIRFICREPGCGEELSDPGSMWRHYQERHNNETNGFVCPYTNCGSIHSTADNLEEHIESCHRQPPALPIEPEIICFEGLENSIDDETNQNEEDCYYETEDRAQKLVVEQIWSRSDRFTISGSDYSPKIEDYGVQDDRSELNEANSYRSEDYHQERKKSPSKVEIYVTESEKSTRITGKSHKIEDYASQEDRYELGDSKDYQSEDYQQDREKLQSKPEVYGKEIEKTVRMVGKWHKIAKNCVQEDFMEKKFDSRSSQCEEVLSHEDTDLQDDKKDIFYINGGDVTITKNLKIEMTNRHGQEHRIDLGNLEKVFRSGFERDAVLENATGADTTLENSSERITSNNCLAEDEEYTPKKQRMSRYKQEPYKCDVGGCGKMYKYISHYRHHQDSHKLANTANNVNSKLARALTRPKQAKATTVSFFLCKMPGCGAQVNNVTSLWKHYHDNHANAKPPLVQGAKGAEIFRCKISNCEMEFNTSSMMYKHLSEAHGTGPNGKTGNGSSIRFADEMFQDEATAHQANFKTDFKAKYNVNIEDYAESVSSEQKSLPRIKEESRD